MFKNLIQLYAMAICFLVSAIAIINLLFFVGNIIDFTLPEFVHKSNLSSFASNKDYLLYEKNKEGSDKEYYDQLAKMTQDEITEARLAERKKYIEDKEAESMQQIIKDIFRILMLLVFFMLHWLLYKKADNKVVAK